MTPKPQWTILTYIAAHNTLDELGRRSLKQILGVGSTANVMHGVLYDGPNGAARYIAGDPGTALKQEQLANYDSGDPGRLVETAQWVFQQYPAEHYGLILWSHGSGWRPEEIEEVATQARGDQAVGKAESKDRAAASGSMALFRSSLQTILQKETPAERAICFDDGSSHSLDTLELERVMNEVHGRIGQPLDLLGMDACLMATLEVAYQLRHDVKYMVASEGLVPGHSWPYDIIFGDLRDHPGCAPADLSISVVNHYKAYYEVEPPAKGDVTKVALDLARLDDLVAKLDCLAAQLRKGMSSQADRLWEAQWTTRMKEARLSDDSEVETMCQPGYNAGGKFCYHLWDLRTLAGRLATGQASPEVRQAAQNVDQALEPGQGAVLAEQHWGNWYDGIGGLTVYCAMPQKTRLSPYYDQLALSVESEWDDMLKAYHKHYAA